MLEQKKTQVQIGWALDGAPIMGPFKDGIRTHKKMLDECHGAMDATSGEYRDLASEASEAVTATL